MTTQPPADSPFDPVRAGNTLASIFKAMMSPGQQAQSPGMSTDPFAQSWGNLPSTRPASYNWDAILAPFSSTTSTIPVVGPSGTVGENPPNAVPPVAPGSHTQVLDQPNVGEGRDYVGAGGHRGEDMGATVGSNVYSPGAGTIIVADANGGEGGNQMYIQLDSGELIKYFHLNDFVQTGGHVDPGQLVAHSGASGYNLSGPHLHMEVWVNGDTVDPVDWLNGAITVPPGQTGGNGVPTSPEPVTVKREKLVTPATEEQRGGAAAQNVVRAMTGTLTPGTYATSGQPEVSGQTTVTTPDNSGIQVDAQGNPTGASVVSSGEGNFAEDFLRSIGAQVNESTLHFMDLWMRFEGGAGHNNPLNTTESNTPGVTGDWNSVGVKIYDTYEHGLQANVKTIQNGMYNAIVDALRRGDGRAAAAALAASPWGTGSAVLANF